MRVLLALAALLAGVSASSQEPDVREVARAAADAPGRALRAGKCCNRAAKLKRKQIVFRQKWRECEAGLAPTECPDWDIDKCMNTHSLARAGSESEPASECETEQLTADKEQLTAEKEQLIAEKEQLIADNAAAIEAAMPSCGWDRELWDGANSVCVCADDAAQRDCSGVCGGEDDSCEGCDGIQNSGLALDVCGVCGGDETSCQGCDGVPNSGLVFDACEICDGPGLNADGCCGDEVMACDGQCTAHLDGRIDDDGNECHLGQNMFCAQVLDGLPCNPRRSGPRMEVEYFAMTNECRRSVSGVWL